MSTLSIPQAGWHLSFFGDSDFIKTKIASYTHQEFNLPMYTNVTAIEEKIKLSKDLFGRNDYAIRQIAVWNNTELPCYYEKYLSDYVLFFFITCFFKMNHYLLFEAKTNKEKMVPL